MLMTTLAAGKTTALTKVRLIPSELVRNTVLTISSSIFTVPSLMRFGMGTSRMTCCCSSSKQVT